MAELRLQGIPAALNFPLLLVFHLEGVSMNDVSELLSELRTFQKIMPELST
jgi:hypothetical protein